MAEFVTVAKVEDIPPGSNCTVEVKGVFLALFNVNGTFYALDNCCPHAGWPAGRRHARGRYCGMPVARLAIQRADRGATGESKRHSSLLPGTGRRRRRTSGLAA